MNELTTTAKRSILSQKMESTQKALYYAIKVLDDLVFHGPVSIQDLIDCTHTYPSTINTHLKRMIKDGIITVTGSSFNERNKIFIELTDKTVPEDDSITLYKEDFLHEGTTLYQKVIITMLRENNCMSIEDITKASCGSIGSVKRAVASLLDVKGYNIDYYNDMVIFHNDPEPKTEDNTNTETKIEDVEMKTKNISETDSKEYQKIKQQLFPEQDEQFDSVDEIDLSLISSQSDTKPADDIPLDSIDDTSAASTASEYFSVVTDDDMEEFNKHFAAINKISEPDNSGKEEKTSDNNSEPVSNTTVTITENTCDKQDDSTSPEKDIPDTSLSDLLNRNTAKRQKRKRAKTESLAKKRTTKTSQQENGDKNKQSIKHTVVDPDETKKTATIWDSMIQPQEIQTTVHDKEVINDDDILQILDKWGADIKNHNNKDSDKVSDKNSSKSSSKDDNKEYKIPGTKKFLKNKALYIAVLVEIVTQQAFTPPALSIRFNKPLDKITKVLKQLYKDGYIKDFRSPILISKTKKFKKPLTIKAFDKNMGARDIKRALQQQYDLRKTTTGSDED